MIEQRTGIIYKATNIHNGRIYVGQSVETLKKRWERHVYASKTGENTVICRAIRVHGAESFVFEVLASKILLKDLNRREQEFVSKFDSYAKGYNQTKGGGGSFGFFHSEETKRKISEAKKGTPSWSKGKKLPPNGPGTGGFNRKMKCGYCNKNITIPNFKRHEKACKKRSSFGLICVECGKKIQIRLFFNKEGLPVNKYCLTSCRMAAIEREAKKGEANKKPAKKKKQMLQAVCVSCGSDFMRDENKGYKRKTCSSKCLRKLIGKNSSMNVGVKRIRSAKKGWITRRENRPI